MEITYTECFKTAEGKAVFVQSAIDDKGKLPATLQEPVLIGGSDTSADGTPVLS